MNLKAGNGEVIATSEIYATEAACMNGIESIRRNAILAKLDNYIPPELREKLEEEALLMAEAEAVLDDDEFELEDQI